MADGRAPIHALGTVIRGNRSEVRRKEVRTSKGGLNLVLHSVFGQTVSYWNGGGDDVRFFVQCVSSGTTVFQEGGLVTEDGVPQPYSLAMGPTSTWTSGGADCTIQADIFGYSGGSGNYQRKFAYASQNQLGPAMYENLSGESWFV